MEAWTFPAGALIVSLATLIYTGMSLRSTAKRGELETVESTLEKRVDYLTEELRLCKEARMIAITARDDMQRELRGIREENFDLMRRVLNIEKKSQ